MREVQQRWIWAHGLLLAAQMLALAWLGRLASLGHGFPLDDAWIHQVVGRTFAETGVLGYSSSAFGSGATSLSWAAISGLNHSWLEVDPTLFTLTVNAVLYLATGQIWLRMLREDGAELGAALGCSLFAATASNFVWFAWSGMESMLLVFLVTVTIALWTRPGHHPRLRAWAAGVCLALAFLTRPEAAALLAVLVAFRVATERRRADLWKVGIPLLVVMAGYVLALKAATGDARPSTLEGRRIIWFQSVATTSPIELAERMLRHWADRLAEHTLATSSSAWLFYGALALCGVGLVLVFRRRWIGFASLVAWAALHLVVYLVLLPTPGHGGRYQPLTPALFLGLGWLGLYGTLTTVWSRLDTRMSRLRTASMVALATLMAIPTARSLSAWARVQRDAVEHIWDTEVAMGRIVKDLPRSATVASFDIGGIGYFSERELLDLGGLVDASLTSALRESNAWPVLKARNVDFVVVPEGYSHARRDPWNFFFHLGLDAAPPGRLIETERLASPEAVWKRGIEATLHASPVQVLYRIDHDP